MDAHIILLLARKEVRDALRNRWFLLYALAFAGLALALSRLSMSGAHAAGYAGFGRTAASLVNLVLLIVPLMALTLGAASLAGERESGTLATLLAQPVLRREVLLGKYLGLSLALGAALALGFGLAAALAAGGGAAVSLGAYAPIVGFAALLALAMLSVGFLISAASKRAGAATSVALFTWLVLVFFGDLGLMTTAVTLKLDPDVLFALAVVNPLEAYKIAAVSAITGSLDALGPAGVYASRTLGQALLPLLAGALLAWLVVPLGLAGLVLERKGIR